MNRYATENRFGIPQSTVYGRCAETRIDGNLNWWWRGNWWRLNPPAVPCTSDFAPVS